MKLKLIKILSILSLFLGVASYSSLSYAQADSDLEDLYDSLEDNEESDEEQIEEAAKTKKKVVTKRDRRQLKKVSELASLEHFKDVAVISKKYMPKSKRFEASLQGVLTTNNAFFSNMGGSVKFGGYFSEKWGIEATYSFLSDSERQTTKSLRDDASIDTKSFVVPEAYYGANLKWSPMYGKMAWFEEKIVSFDLYFTLGGGKSKTKIEDETTFSVGAGQLYSLNKSWALRWDANVNFYKATIVEFEGTINEKQSEENHFDIFLGVGVSFFFPGVN